MNSIPWIGSLLLSLGVGYALGAIPFAYLVARSQGVNIFEEGSKQAGASNVWITTSGRYGVIVFSLDCAKGLSAIIFARLLGITDLWLFFPASTAILAHWNSPFTGFKGGDGVSTWMGIMGGVLGLVGVTACFVMGFATLLGNVFRWHHPTFIGGGLACFTVLAALGISEMFQISEPFFLVPDPWVFLAVFPSIWLITGVLTLWGVVLPHSILYHMRYLNPEQRTASSQHN